MAQIIVADLNGRQLVEVIFRSSPPAMEGVVYAASNQKIGLIKSRYAQDEGTVHDAAGHLVGSVSGHLTGGGPFCVVTDSQHQSVGGVRDGQVLMQGWPPESWRAVGTMASASWQAADTDGVRQAARTSGAAAGESELKTLVPTIQHKQRVLAGCAALLLKQVGPPPAQARAGARVVMPARPLPAPPPTRRLAQPRPTVHTVATASPRIQPGLLSVGSGIVLLLCAPLWLPIVLVLCFLTWLGGTLLYGLLLSLPIFILVSLTLLR